MSCYSFVITLRIMTRLAQYSLGSRSQGRHSRREFVGVARCYGYDVSIDSTPVARRSVGL